MHCSLVLLNEQCLKWNGPFILTTAIAIRFPPLKDSANYSPNIVWDKHPPKTYLPKKNTLTSSYLKCVCLIYRFSKKKNHFQSPPKWAEAGAKARAGLIIPPRPKRFESRGPSAKAIWPRGPGKTPYRSEQAIRAQLFKDWLDLDLGLNLTQVSFFPSKTFFLLFLRASNHQLADKKN